MSNWEAHGEPDSVDEVMRQLRTWIDSPLPAPPRSKVREMRERIKRRAKDDSSEWTYSAREARSGNILPDSKVLQPVTKDSYFTPQDLIERMISNLVILLPESTWREAAISDPAISGPAFELDVKMYDGTAKRDAALHIWGERWAVETKRRNNRARELVQHHLSLLAHETDENRLPIMRDSTSTLVVFVVSHDNVSASENRLRLKEHWLDVLEISELSAIAVIPLNAVRLIAPREKPAILHVPETLPARQPGTDSEIIALLRSFVREALLNHYANFDGR
ncbi:hypothetical protein ACPCSG_19390 [Streptomyces cellulosae]